MTPNQKSHLSRFIKKKKKTGLNGDLTMLAQELWISQASWLACLLTVNIASTSHINHFHIFSTVGSSHY